MTSDPPDARAAGRHERVPFLRDVRVISGFAQVIVLAAVLLVAAYLLSNLFTAMERRGFLPDLGFLSQAADFEIGEHAIDYAPSDTFGTALLVGLVNTLIVSAVGILIATLLGLVVGIARLSRNWLVAKLALLYVELFRNTPLLVQLLVIYFVVFLQMPRVRDAIALPGGIFLSQRGVYMPRPELGPSGGSWILVVVLALVLAGSAWLLASRREEAGRSTLGLRWVAVSLLVGLPALAWLTSPSVPLTFVVPEQGAFNFSGGVRLTPEFAALTVGLGVYTAAFIAEIIRGGILAVSTGQREAARAIGLSEGQTMRLVILPQALRVIVPPLTSQYLNLIKNSSLALVIGYADLFNISRTVSELTGQPVTVIVLVMGVYLVISLVTSLLMNLYNRRVQIPGH
jgi:general L-amino acid transport system permease protein